MQSKPLHTHQDCDGASSSPNNLSPLEHRAVESMLVTEMNRLSVQEREYIQEEIHGVMSRATEESAQMVQCNLQAMQDAIDTIPIKNGYNQGHDMYSSQQQRLKYPDQNVKQECYVFNLHLRIRFLRYELWNPVLAARRFIKYLDLLLEYIGPEALMRPVRKSV
jgi:hypothetical protein